MVDTYIRSFLNSVREKRLYDLVAPKVKTLDYTTATSVLQYAKHVLGTYVQGRLRRTRMNFATNDEGRLLLSNDFDNILNKSKSWKQMKELIDTRKYYAVMQNWGYPQDRSHHWLTAIRNFEKIFNMCDPYELLRTVGLSFVKVYWRNVTNYEDLWNIHLQPPYVR